MHLRISVGPCSDVCNTAYQVVDLERRNSVIQAGQYSVCHSCRIQVAGIETIAEFEDASGDFLYADNLYLPICE
jgi:hypothetical protein